MVRVRVLLAVVGALLLLLLGGHAVHADGEQPVITSAYAYGPSAILICHCAAAGRAVRPGHAGWRPRRHALSP
jgi:hypothetical protein